MSVLTNNLNSILSIKADIKSAIEAKGVDMTGISFPGYASKIGEISGGSGWDQKSLTEGTNEITNLDNSASFVASYAFAYNKNIQTVNLPYATSVGASAFNFCRSLTNVNLPMCSYIGSSAFADCYLLSQVSLPVCSYIDEFAFASCSSLTQISLPECSYIAFYAFYWCFSLSQISLPVCSYIGSYAFKKCTNLNEVNLPVCSFIGSYAFADCSSLSQVNLNNWQNTGSEAFMGCTSLESITNTNSQQGLLILGDTRGLFSGCINLSYFGSYVFNSLGDYMFAGTALTSYKFYAFTEHIGDYVFQNCTSLTEIDLKNMESIVKAGTSIFDGCTNLSVIYINNEEYRTAQGWSEYSSLMSLIENLPELSFENGLLYGSISAISSADWTALGISTTDIISVSLPDCLSVSTATFRTCYSLTSVSLPMCENLGLSAFQMCRSLNSIYLPVVSIIGSYCFNNCGSLSSIMLPECITFNKNIFTGCSMLSTIVLPKLQRIDASVFRVLSNSVTNTVSLYMGGSDVVNTGTAVASKLFFSNVQKHIYVRSSLIDMYQQHSIWGQINNVQWFNYEDSPYYTE